MGPLLFRFIEARVDDRDRDTFSAIGPLELTDARLCSCIDGCGVEPLIDSFSEPVLMAIYNFLNNESKEHFFHTIDTILVLNLCLQL
jgi:hypothetical protein